MSGEKKQYYFKDMDYYIRETPEVLMRILKNRKDILRQALDILAPDQTELILMGSGSSYTAALTAKYYLQKTLKKSITVLYPNNVLRYEKFYNKKAAVVGISQSGNSVALISAIRKMKEAGYPVIALTQDASSDAALSADALMDFSCGEESCGPKTKGYSVTVFLLMLLGLEYALERNQITEKEYADDLQAAEETIQNLLCVREDMENWYDQNRERMIAVQKISCVGYGANFGTAVEGSLKLIETVRCPAYGYEFEEYLHGPNDGIDRNSTIFLLGSPDQELDRMKRLLKFASGITSECFLFTSGTEEKQDNEVGIRFKNCKDFFPLEYAVVVQYLAYRISKDRAVDLNVIKYPEYYTIMNCKTKL